MAKDNVRWSVVLALLMAETLASAFTDSNEVPAVVVAAVMVCACLIAWLLAVLRGRISLVMPPFDDGGSFGLLVAAGLYGTAVAILRGNKPYYVAADLYHWWGELIAVAYLSFLIFRNAAGEAVIRFLVITSLVLALIGLFAETLGVSGVIDTGGHLVRDLGVWRLSFGRGYPEIILVMLSGTFLYRGSLSQQTRILRAIAMIGLLVTLAFTLKRTYFISYLGAVTFLWLSKNQLRALFASLLLLIPAAAITFYLSGDLHSRMLVAIADLLTYNPSYTVQDTLQEREEQITNVLPYLLKNQFGYGFGAEFYTYWPGENQFGYVHYIHNLYVYYGLQLGLPGLAAFLGAIGLTLRWLWRNLNVRASDYWLVKTIMAVLLVLLVNGMLLNSTHTVIAGIAYGMGYTVIARRSKTASASSAPSYSTDSALSAPS